MLIIAFSFSGFYLKWLVFVNFSAFFKFKAGMKKDELVKLLFTINFPVFEITLKGHKLFETRKFKL